MSKSLEEKIVFLPKINPDLIRASSDWSETEAYWVIDRRPKVGEYYINLHVVERERSIQKHSTLRHLRNHKKDYRFKHCWTVVRTTNTNLIIPIKSKPHATLNPTPAHPNLTISRMGDNEEH